MENFSINRGNKSYIVRLMELKIVEDINIPIIPIAVLQRILFIAKGLVIKFQALL